MPKPDHNRGRNHNNSYGSFPSSSSSLPTITTSSAVDNSSSPHAHSTPTTTQPDPHQQPPQQRIAPSSLSSLQHSSSTASCNNTNDRKKNKNTNTPPIGRDQSPASFRSSGSSVSCSSLPRGVNNNNSSTSASLAKDQPWQSKVKAGSTVVGQFVRRKIPILSWLVSSPGYNWKNDLTQDLFAGVSKYLSLIALNLLFCCTKKKGPLGI